MVPLESTMQSPQNQPERPLGGIRKSESVAKNTFCGAHVPAESGCPEKLAVLRDSETNEERLSASATAMITTHYIE